MDISDLDVHEVIAELWRRSHPAGFFIVTRIHAPQTLDRAIIADHLANDKYIDYLEGRCIKIDFSNLTRVDPHLYDRDMGPGAFAAVVAYLRNK